MYKVIYDYVGENDSCRGIEDECSSYEEAQQLREDLKANDDYCNIQIVDCNWEE